MTIQPRHPESACRPPDLPAYRDALIEGCRRTDGVTSLVFYGSASDGASGRRDEWSDVDFNVFFTPERSQALRADWPFLPDPERIVLRGREGDNGGLVLYDDGMLFEFGAGLPWQITDPARDIVLDGGDLRFGDVPAPPDAADQIRIFLVKLYIGVGRYRRGERVAAHAHVRTYALTALAWALRLRLGSPEGASPYDPLRRLDSEVPGVGAELSALLDEDLETCARGMVRLARGRLEPGWPDFPTAGADTIERRLGWT